MKVREGIPSRHRPDQPPFLEVAEVFLPQRRIHRPQVARAVVPGLERLQVRQACLEAELVLGEHAPNGRRRLDERRGRNDDGRARSDVGGKDAAEPFDEGAHIPFREQRQPAGNRDVVTGKRLPGPTHRSTHRHARSR